MDKIVRADPYSRQIGFTVEVLGQANLVVQCINARAWKAKDLGFDVSDLPNRLVQDFARLGLTAENTGWSGLQ